MDKYEKTGGQIPSGFGEDGIGKNASGGTPLDFNGGIDAQTHYDYKKHTDNLGFIGKFIGGGSNSKTNIAFIIIILAVIGAIVLFVFDKSSDKSLALKYGSVFAGVLLSVTGYLFGTQSD
jgi:hypothetical protein